MLLAGDNSPVAGGRWIALAVLSVMFCFSCGAAPGQGPGGAPRKLPATIPSLREEMEAAMSGPDYRLSLADPNIYGADLSDVLAAETPAAPFSPGWQEVRFIASWLPGGGANELGFTDLELKAKIGLPPPLPYSMITLSPGAGMHLVDGPQPRSATGPDLPQRLYDVYLDAKWVQPFSEELAMELAVTPGVYSDFLRDHPDAFRLGARAVGYYTVSPQVRYALGVAYLDREDVSFIPVGGLIFTPNLDTRLELVIPRPKFARRFDNCGGVEHWWYLAGEFGGGSWAVRRASGASDIASYSDLRIALGLERKSPGGLTALVEVGYVFARSLEYRSRRGDFDPDDTLLLRAAVAF